ERLAAVKEKDRDGYTVLHLALMNPDSLRMILALYPESERLAAVKKDRYGDTALQEAVSNPESLRMMLALLPESERLAAVKEKNRFGYTVLQRSASTPGSLGMMLELLPVADLLVLSNDHPYIFSGDNVDLVKGVLYEKLNTYCLDESDSGRVKVLLDESRTLNDLIRIMEEMQNLRPQAQSIHGFFQNSVPEKDTSESKTQNIKPKG
ncbi:MAG: hypothetical protein ACOYKA_06035, partial [Legionellaceae bacterium]